MEKATAVDRVEAVDILRRVDRLDHGAGLVVRRQRQLDQDAVHRRVGVQARDDRQEFGGPGIGRKADRAGPQPGLLRRAVLVADVNGTGRVVANEDHRQAGLVRQHPDPGGDGGT